MPVLCTLSMSVTSVLGGPRNSSKARKVPMKILGLYMPLALWLPMWGEDRDMRLPSFLPSQVSIGVSLLRYRHHSDYPIIVRPGNCTDCAAGSKTIHYHDGIASATDSCYCRCRCRR
ncbi:hypothetical protein H4582DRAFT_1234968 [Lactarius indigo]|nr:hypothetical protein H4582DRAFT_1234968 [Lactarius indigo]